MAKYLKIPFYVFCLVLPLTVHGYIHFARKLGIPLVDYVDEHVERWPEVYG